VGAAGARGGQIVELVALRGAARFRNLNRFLREGRGEAPGSPVRLLVRLTAAVTLGASVRCVGGAGGSCCRAASAPRRAGRACGAGRRAGHPHLHRRKWARGAARMSPAVPVLVRFLMSVRISDRRRLFADGEIVCGDRMLSVNGRVRDNWRVRQLSLFDRATTAAMRDRTRSRNYSPERDEFRREHERRRYWGLQRRHAEKLRRIHGDPTPPTTVPDQPRPAPPPPAVPAPVAATPPPVSPDRSAPAPRPARPHVNAPPVAAATPTAARPATKKRIQPPRDKRRHSTPPAPRRQQFNGGHETYALSSITRDFTHPQKARAPPGERILTGGRASENERVSALI